VGEPLKRSVPTMKILVTILVVVAVIWLIIVLIRSQGRSQEPDYSTRDQIPSIVSKLQKTGRDGSFVVFMFSIPGNHDETLPNLQYSIEKGRLGLDWVLLAPRNVEDELELADFMKRDGYTVLKREMNEVRYLRVEGDDLENLGIRILRDFYHLAPEARLELITEGFDMND
jgi:hypothetical protein